jgi:hypothetical protein
MAHQRAGSGEARLPHGRRAARWCRGLRSRNPVTGSNCQDAHPAEQPCVAALSRCSRGPFCAGIEVREPWSEPRTRFDTSRRSRRRRSGRRRCRSSRPRSRGPRFCSNGSRCPADRASARSVRRLAPPLSSRSPCVALDGMLLRRGHGGCEVMAFPNVILRRRDVVGRHWFEPIDRLDTQGREPPRSFYRAA